MRDVRRATFDFGRVRANDVVLVNLDRNADDRSFAKMSLCDREQEANSYGSGWCAGGVLLLPTSVLNVVLSRCEQVGK